MYVIKRSERKEEVRCEKISRRIESMTYGLAVSHVDVSRKVVAGLFDGVSTKELDNLAAETAASMTTHHPDYSVLASRLAVSNLHKETDKLFSDVARRLYQNDAISDQTFDMIISNADRLDSAILSSRDYDINYFGLKTLERSYLIRIDGRIVERPQHMFMRVAVGICGYDVAAVIETYDLMSQKLCIHATPTLFNSGTKRPQMSSCFLLTMREDSIEGIFDTLSQCAQISKNAGGVGLDVHCIRSTGAPIKGTNGVSNGLVPMLRVFNNVARYVDQGGNKRPGAFAIYLEPWHADVFEFLDLKKNTGKEETRARDLFYGMWIPDLFMRRVKDDMEWTLMCPEKCAYLHTVWGESFERLYCFYEDEGFGKRTVKARDLWHAIVTSQIETGTPYVLYKDACNRKSNQQHLGTMTCSNLCSEIIEYCSKDEVAVCNLASIALSKFVNVESCTFDFEMLARVTGVLVRNLNKIIDLNFYPLEEAERSNKRHRPMGIGVQGLADAFLLMRIAYESDRAHELNRNIFETMYYSALSASCDLAKEYGAYETYAASPVSLGILQPDMWNVATSDDRHDWTALRAKISNFGIRNSLLIALMPTASTAQILGNCESFEPYTSNVYTRRVLSGEFSVVNTHLVKDLIDRGLWSDEMRNALISNGGSVQDIKTVPDDLKALYKTVWEIKQKTLLQMAADRAPFVDQSQSLNVYVADPTYASITSMHFYGWELGLKTGMYYLRTKPAANAIRITVDTNKKKKKKNTGGDNDDNDNDNLVCVKGCSGCSA